ncbi:MAG TPA: ABC-type transport auxiliary lipoprotein family protein [Caulobacteraceae bacterium]|jgi:cholesterol transport system auxiliary component
MINSGAARLAASSLAVGLCAGLAGCISLFPAEKPVQLYRFDATVQPMQSTGHSFGVRVGMSDFDTAAMGDRIMTVDGDQIAYIDAGRWANPAVKLFDQAVARGFAAPGDAARLVSPNGGKAEYRLRLNVSSFEARYPSGPTSTPTVTIVMRATLDRASDSALIGTRVFEADVPAGDNRIGPIVQAFDQATTKVVGDLVAWVDQKGG